MIILNIIIQVVGEQVTWKLSPNMFGNWGDTPKDRKDTILTVTTTRIDGADEKIDLRHKTFGM